MRYMLLPRLKMDDGPSPITILRCIFQRLPGLGILCFLVPVSLIGPFVCPKLFVTYFLFLHLIFLGNALRTVCGMRKAYFLTVESSTTDWRAKYLQSNLHPPPLVTFDSIIHVILIPNYKESVDTLSETLDVLASHEMARTQYRVCLAMEGAERNSVGKAKLLVRNYSSCFLDLCFTVHPNGLHGEIRGKSSNVSWAANQMVLRSTGHIETYRQIFTVIDADSHFAQDYFESVAFHYSVASIPEKRRMMFVPPTLFDRNADQVPALVRVTDIFWSAGVLSNLYPSSSIKIPCSAYSISMDLSITVRFWDVGPEALGEDLHMYLKVFFSTYGQAKVIPIYSPASQCNVQSCDTGLQGWFKGLCVRYSQAKRHLWGSLDTGYALSRLSEQLLYRKRGIKKNHKLCKEDDETDPHAISYAILVVKLVHRLLEAHIFMGHLFFLLATTTLIVPNRGHFPFSYIFGSLAMAPLPDIVLNSSDIGFWLRLLAALSTIGTIYYYGQYHRWASRDRWILQRVMRSGRRTDSAIEEREPHGAVQYLGKRGRLSSTRSSFYSLLDWAAIPLSGLLFYVLPQFHAQICHLWTSALDYQVAAKPRLDSLKAPLSELLSCPSDSSY